MSYYTCDVPVLRDNQFKIVSSTELVPGDIIKVQQSVTLPCDVSLLQGQVICNESMLTGESIPVTKYSVLSQQDFIFCQQQQQQQQPIQSQLLELKDLVKEKRSMLYGGTIVVKTIAAEDQPVLGMVRNTAFQTTKGKLILSILFPSKSHFKFFTEALKFIGVLCIIALVGFSVSVWRLATFGVDAKTIAQRALDLVTVIIPPALPMAMTVGTGFALIRLKHSKIYCISPPRLNMAGKIQVFCFDKTGTLTEEGLDLNGVLLNRDQLGSFGEYLSGLEAIMNQLDKRIFRLLMATCHSLSNINNQVSGDPLEIKIFKSTQSTIDDSKPKHEIHIPSNECLPEEMITVQERFDFQSQLQRMSVIITTASGECFSLVKGSPEMIKRMCLSETIPPDYDKRLSVYTKNGYRVLACAYRDYDPQLTHSINTDLLRQSSEESIRFIGFIIMENKVKPQSQPIINTLQKAFIRTIMVTGDNPLTAVSVAYSTGILRKEQTVFMGSVQHLPEHNASGKSEIIDWENITLDERGEFDPQTHSIHHLDPTTLLMDGDDHTPYSLVITGPVFKKLYTNYLQTGSLKFVNMLRHGLVYSRMTPDDKQILIEELQRVGLYVAMCGDGANDCGALKAAHVGISLSETEASIAAPFTSTTPNISCCPTLILEGRASLAISFKLFQFMGMYSMIQFTTLILLVFVASLLGNWMYLFQDLYIIFPLVIFMGMTRPSSKLSIKRPSSRLMSGAIVGSLILHILVCVAFQVAVFFLVRTKSWYNEDVHDEENIITYPTTSLFILGCFQYLIMALVFSMGKPFLKPLYTNRYLFVTYLIALVTTVLILFLPNKNVWKFAELLIVPVSWRFTMFALIIANLVVCIIVEYSFYYYKTHKKKSKSRTLDQVFSKDAPKDFRITENSVLLPIS
eukprot:gene436-551_t